MTANPLSSELLALAERVEGLRACGDDWRGWEGWTLQKAVALAVGWTVEKDPRNGDDWTDQNGKPAQDPMFLVSIDAASTLVPEGCLWVGGLAQTGRAAMAVCPFGSTVGEHSTASTPALALTAASLRAIAAQQPNTTGDE